MAIEDVVTENETRGIVVDEAPTDNERFGKAARLRLLRVLEAESPLASVSKKPFEKGSVAWVGDDENVSNPGQHQGRERVVDHGFVIDRHQLLADHESQWVQSGPVPAGEDDSFAVHLPSPSRSPR